MRTLRFIVDNQLIRKDPTCNFENIVAGSKGYLVARFRFSREWEKCLKVGKFTCLGKEYYAPIKGNECIIPSEALIWTSFTVAAIGKMDDFQIITDAVRVEQRRGSI